MKELPYFKFEPAEWIIGDISFQDYEVKGLFIDVCCFYWMKLGAIDKQMLSKRYSNVKQMIDILISENILKVDENNKIIIDFLDAQLTGFKQISELRSKAGKLGVIGKQANAKQMLSKSLPIRLDKIREDKKERYGDVVSLEKEKYETLCFQYGKKEVDNKIDDINNYCLSKGKRYKDYAATIRAWFKKDGVMPRSGEVKRCPNGHLYTGDVCERCI